MKLVQIDDYRDTSTAGFTKRMIHQSENGLVFLLNFEPGQELPAHTHADSEIVATVLDGDGQATIDGRVQAVRRGSIVQCNGSESFSVQNTGRNALSLLVFLAPGNPRFAGNIR